MRKDLFSKFESSPIFKGGSNQDNGGYYFERPWLGLVVTIVVIIIIAVSVI